MPTVVSYNDYKDPLQWLNRPIFRFNDVSYRYVLSPVGKGYRKLPQPARKHIGQFFNNLREPLDGVNHLLQGQPAAAGKNLLRFGINSTLGLLGLFDPAASQWGLEHQPATFADTLTTYGAGYGAYLVLPILGPSDLRNGTSLLFDYLAHPVYFVTDRTTGSVVRAADSFQELAPILERYPDLVGEVDDPYLFVRNFYLQQVQRDADLRRHGLQVFEKAPPAGEPPLSE